VGTGSPEEMKVNAKDAFEKALEEEELAVTVVRDEQYVGNARGLGLAGVGTEIASLKGQVGLLQGKVKGLEGKVRGLEDHVGVLKNIAQDYRRVRHRFISTFKRDKLHNARQFDLDIINRGSAVAHGGLSQMPYCTTVRMEDEISLFLEHSTDYTLLMSQGSVSIPYSLILSLEKVLSVEFNSEQVKRAWGPILKPGHGERWLEIASTLPLYLL